MSFQEISKDPVNIYGTINDGRGLHDVVVKLEPDTQISELAKKIFPDYYEQLITKIEAYKIALHDLEKQKNDLEKSWTYWVYKNNSYLRVGQGTISAISASGLVIDSIVSQHTTLVKGIFIVGGFGVSILSLQNIRISLPALAFLQWDKVEDKINTLNASIVRVEHNRKASESLTRLAAAIAEFISAWDMFDKHPHEGRIQVLFSLLEEIENQCDSYNKACFELDIEDFYRNSSSDIDQNFYLNKDMNRIFLMDQICEKLKKGKVHSEWKALKNSTANNFLWASPKAEPWQSLQMKNPDMKSYFSFFATPSEQKAVSIAERLKLLFANIFS